MMVRARGQGLAQLWAIMICSLATATAQAQDPPATRRDDIVVEGQKTHPSRTTLAKRYDELSSARREAYQNALLWARCAIRTRPAAARAVVDGAPASFRLMHDLDQLVRRTRPCRPNSAGDSMVGPGEFGRSALVRIALIEASLHRHRPALDLMPAQTADRVVQQRFNAREPQRNAARVSADQLFFEVSVCMVRLQPQLAVQLSATNSGSVEEDTIESLIVDRARLCVGDARQLVADRTLLRGYLVDALYRWVVAAEGADSLFER